MSTDFNWTKLGQEILALRERQGLTLRDLEDKIGVNKSALTRAENGNAIEVPNFVKIIQWLKRRPERFLIRK